MKLSPFTILFFPLAISACSNYQSCHCYDSNGVPNNAATAQVCAGFGDRASMADASRGSDGARECKANKSKEVVFSNCSWRQWCQIAGATGKDSSCRDKKT
ncbi:hypothetical protein COCSADRAFT_255613 [Bipolaris sorokiniana ND90Pr]|uniref:Lipoprotein n=1 Tax=Cochliobolus sativus (strain ND90Pr / ATCC 201652) TaxID=665912 RepID=M2S9E1_COCSN|nr:uncharacterized protein COCSADRAFT_255613 [Bipolaris sorokiniana ND90Pr]EMD59160.1 hypothetical protein COCSADRAFT_255613 [Bipolaris sorokiniana ND90Pr]